VKLLVVGAGAVGSLFAARLAAAGYDVELTARPEHVSAIRAQGLRVEGTTPGTYHPIALGSLAEAASPDAVLVTVKTFDLAETASALGRRFPLLPPTLLPQNGLHVERSFADALPPAVRSGVPRAVVRAINSIPVTLVGPGVIRQAGVGQLLLRDPGSGGREAEATAEFVELLRRAELPVRLVVDFERELWRKALVNAAINPVTAIRRVPNGRLLEPPFRDEAIALLREAQRAAAAAGVPFSDDEAERDFERVARATAENRSSMLQDLDRGRPTEIDAISGEIVRTAGGHGIDLPRTRAAIAQLHAATSGPRTQPS